MSLLALTAAVLLSQAAPAEEPAAPVAPPAAAPADPVANPSAPRPRPPSSEELQRQLDRIRKLPPGESSEAMQELLRKFPDMNKQNAGEPVDDGAHGAEVAAAFGGTGQPPLSDAEQVKYTARHVFNAIIAGDARSLVLQSTYPFQLEDRRLEMPDELHKEWLKNLRSKRTDLVTLYDVEVFTPAEMEKKYGRPPARLNAMPWKVGKTMIAVANFSGRAAVAVFRSQQQSGRWMLVGYHD